PDCLSRRLSPQVTADDSLGRHSLPRTQAGRDRERCAKGTFIPLQIRAKIRGRRKRLHDEMLAVETCGPTVSPDAQKDNTEEETIDVIGYDEQDDADWLNAAAAPAGNSSQTSDHDEFNQCTFQSRETTAEDLRTRNTIDKDRVRCSVCREPYKNPVTSVQCWHVYCEACWIQSLVRRLWGRSLH
ncbi:hypothetical protein LSAT2_013096, partial [Lamellibrachia satsuma]